MKEKFTLKNVLIVIAAAAMAVLIGTTMVMSDRPMNEASYIALINRNDRDIRNVDKVDVQVVKLVQMKPIGWVAYGSAGGAWVSSSKPPINKDNTLVAAPESYRYVFDRWVIIYHYPKPTKR